MAGKRTTQVPVEVVYNSADTKLRATQVVVEVVYQQGAAPPSQRFKAQVIG